MYATVSVPEPRGPDALSSWLIRILPFGIRCMWIGTNEFGQLLTKLDHWPDTDFGSGAGAPFTVTFTGAEVAFRFWLSVALAVSE
jgi:hypothetical protein